MAANGGFGESPLLNILNNTGSALKSPHRGGIDALSRAVSGKINLSAANILIVIGICTALFVFCYYQLLTFKKNQMVKDRKGNLYKIEPGLETEYKPSEKKLLMMRLLDSMYAPISLGKFARLKQVEDTFSFEIHGTGMTGYGTYVWVPEHMAKKMPTQLRTYFTNPIEIADEDDPAKIIKEALSDEEGHSKSPDFYSAEYTVSADSFLPIEEWAPGTTPIDPMEHLFSVMDSLLDNHVAGVVVTLKNTDNKWQNEGLKFLQSLEYDVPTKQSFASGLVSFWRKGGAVEAAARKNQGNAPKRKTTNIFEKADADLVSARVKQNGFNVVVRIYSSEKTIFELLCGAFEKEYSGKLNSLVVNKEDVSLEDMYLRWFDNDRMILTTGEISGIFHPADENTRARRLQRGGSSTSSADDNVGISDGTYDPFRF